MINILQYPDDQIESLNSKLDEYIKETENLIESCQESLKCTESLLNQANDASQLLKIPSQQSSQYYKAKYQFKKMKNEKAKKTIKPVTIVSGMSTITGKRPVNEDAHVMVQISQNMYAYAIFDGHAGVGASQYCSENFKETFEEKLKQEGNPVTALESSFESLDEKFNQQSGMSGCTATVCIVDTLSRDVITANAGDSRQISILLKKDENLEQDSTQQEEKESKSNDQAIEIQIEDQLGSSQQQNDTKETKEENEEEELEESKECNNEPIDVKQLTFDHKPSVDSESVRIRSYGSFVTTVLGIPRVAGQLAVSRAIGDVNYKLLGVIATPDVFEYEQLLDDAAAIILACDGLYDVLSNRETMIIVGTLLKLIDEDNCKQLKLNPRQTAILKASLEYKNRNFEQGDQILKDLQEGFWLNMQSVEQIEQDDNYATFIAKILTRVAYILGSTDNISAIVILKGQ